jgi:hypothetical protein
VKYLVGDALEYTPDAKFSVVILSDVLEHIKNREQFLERIKSEIAPEKLLIRVPLFERDWRVPLKQELGVEWWLDATHETEYTLGGFDEEVRSAGFDVAHIEARWAEIWAEVRALESANGNLGSSPSHLQT